MPVVAQIWRRSSVGQSIRFIPEVSPVRIQSPLPNARKHRKMLSGIYGPLVKWLRHRPFTAVTRVRVSYGSPGGLAQLVRAPASHAGGHWFESSSLHQEKSLEPQGFEDFSFLRTRKYWVAGLAVICGKIRPFFMPLLQKCCKFFESFNPLHRNGLEGFSVSIGDCTHLPQGSHLCKEFDCCKFATIEQNQEVLKAFRTFSAVCASRERRS